MTKMPSLNLLTAGIILLFVIPAHGAVRSAVGTKDGLELIVSTVITQEVLQPSIECRLRNTTDQDIPFDLTRSRHFRLSFILLDAQGVEIPMDREWKRRNAPSDEEMGFSRHCSSAVQKGNDRVFSFRPDEAYGERWKKASRLVVSWEPGFDWAWPFKPYTQGRGLAVTYDIPKEDSNAATNVKPNDSPAFEPLQHSSRDIDLMKANKKLESNPESDSSSAEQPNTTSWIILVVLAVTVVAVVWLMFNKCSSAKN